MAKATGFVFDDYQLSDGGKQVDFSYHTEFDDGQQRQFTESLSFQQPLPDPSSNSALASALHFYHIVAGISYYKAHLAPQISSHGLDPWAAQAMSQIYLNGLGEFLYVNQLSPSAVASFTAEAEQQAATQTVTNQDWLLPIGGGKDSLVSATILEQTGQPFVSFRINSNQWLDQQLEQLGAPQQLVTRQFDEFLTSDATQLKGHVPITAIVSAAAVIVAVAQGYRAVAFSNESSADEPTIADYQGMAVNHQWAKSSAAERLIAEWIVRYVSTDLEYFSLLRSLGELEIAELFAAAALPRFSGLWSSSNANFRHDSDGQLSWELTSPKTCTVLLLLAPFTDRQQLITEFGGNPFELKENQQTWAKLLGQQASKPFECVATIEEMQQARALAVASGQWPEAANL